MDSDTASEGSIDNSRQCRICWGEEGDPAAGLSFVSPCKCAGSLNYMHLRCLQEWQQVLRSQGEFRKARHCEICKHPYRMSSPASCSGSSGRNTRWAYFSQLLKHGGQKVLDLLSCQSYLGLAYRIWKMYILGSSVIGAARVGVAGLRAGFGMGKSLVEEQTSILLNMLAALGDLLGTPYAELLWCQAVACVAFALLSEVVYTSLLGALAGGVIGFFRGYMGAIQASFGVVTSGLGRSLSAGRALAKAARLALRLPLGALRAAVAVAARRLPVRIIA